MVSVTHQECEVCSKTVDRRFNFIKESHSEEEDFIEIWQGDNEWQVCGIGCLLALAEQAMRLGKIPTVHGTDSTN